MQKQRKKEPVNLNFDKAIISTPFQAEKEYEKQPVAWKRVLQYADFRLLWLGAFLFHTGMWMLEATFGWLSYDLTNDKGFLALVLTCKMLPYAVLGPFIGPILDLYNKRKIMLLSHFCFIGIVILTGLSLSFGLLTPSLLLVSSSLLGVICTFEAPARQSLTSMLVPKKDFTAAFPLQVKSLHAAKLVGPILAGFIMRFYSPAGCFYFSVFAFLSLAIVVLQLKTDLSSKIARKISTKSALKDGIGFILSDSRLRFLFGAASLVTLTSFFYPMLLPAYARDVLELDEVGLGRILCATGIGAFGSLVFKTTLADRPILGYLPIFATTGLGVFLFFLASNTGEYAAYLILILIGFFHGLLTISTRTISQILTPVELRGRVMSIEIWVFIGVAALSGLIFGKLAQTTSISFVYNLGALFVLGIALFMWKYRGVLTQIDRERD